MRIQHLYKNRQVPADESRFMLKSGQIVQGNINKIFPNGRAQISLGSQQFTAQLQAALSVGKSYHFQIQQVEDDLIHLRVLTEQENINNLLRHFGIRPTTEQINLIESFMSDRIPFQPSEMVKALNLYNNSGNKMTAQTILKQMFLQQLPINETVFQSLYMNQTTNFTNVIHSFKQTINANDFPILNNHLQQLTSKNHDLNTSLVRQIITHAMRNENISPHLVQAMGTGTQHEQPSQLGQSNEQTFIHNIVNHLLQNQNSLMSESRALLQEWGDLTVKTNHTDTTQLTRVKQMINERILPLLTSEQQSYILNLVEQNQLGELLEVFTNLSTEKTYQLVSQLPTTMDYELPKQQFLHQLNLVLSHTGLSYENLLVQDQGNESQPINLKAMLMQYIEQHEGVSKERAQQLIQFINGLQIQSVQESTHFIQANIVVPSENLGLHKDLQLEFESKKTSKGKINPNHCRILFYLDLTQLKETVIDMNIQKRLVSLTIYNDQTSHLESLSKLFKSQLSKGLKTLDYDLTKIKIRRLTKKSEAGKTVGTKHWAQQSTYEGIDYKV